MTVSVCLSVCLSACVRVCVCVCVFVRDHIFRTARPIFTNFYHAMLCIRGTSHGPVSFRLSVCPSVTSRSSTKTAKRRIT